MAIRVGSIASGADFFGRNRELADLWQQLAKDHISLTGPRRLGKSSILKRMVEEAETQGYIAQHIDLEGLDSISACLQQIEAAFPEAWLTQQTDKLKNLLRQFGSRFKKFDVKLPGGVGAGLELQAGDSPTWQAVGVALQQRLSPQPILLLLDEFSVFLEKLIQRDKHEADLFLAWLRAWRMTEPTCRFVFSGSVGINALLERHHMSIHLNDCYEYKLPAFRPVDACQMLQAFAQREGWQLTPELANYLCERIAWLSPFYLCLLLDETIKCGRDRYEDSASHTLTSAPQVLAQHDVDTAYAELVSSRSHFVHWYQRLHRDFSDRTEQELTLAMLRFVAQAPQPLTAPQLFRRLSQWYADDPERREQQFGQSLGYLEEHGYLGQDQDGKLAFLSFLLRDYWQKNHAHHE